MYEIPMDETGYASGVLISRIETSDEFVYFARLNAILNDSDIDNTVLSYNDSNINRKRYKIKVQTYFQPTICF